MSDFENFVHTQEPETSGKRNKIIYGVVALIVLIGFAHVIRASNYSIKDNSLVEKQTSIDLAEEPAPEKPVKCWTSQINPWCKYNTTKDFDYGNCVKYLNNYFCDRKKKVWCNKTDVYEFCDKRYRQSTNTKCKEQLRKLFCESEDGWDNEDDNLPKTCTFMKGYDWCVEKGKNIGNCLKEMVNENKCDDNEKRKNCSAAELYDHCQKDKDVKECITKREKSLGC